MVDDAPKAGRDDDRADDEGDGDGDDGNGRNAGEGDGGSTDRGSGRESGLGEKGADAGGALGGPVPGEQERLLVDDELADLGLPTYVTSIGLFLIGVGGIVGTLLIGRISSRSVFAALVAGPAVVAAGLAVLLLAGGNLASSSLVSRSGASVCPRRSGQGWSGLVSGVGRRHGGAVRLELSRGRPGGEQLEPVLAG